MFLASILVSYTDKWGDSRYDHLTQSNFEEMLKNNPDTRCVLDTVNNSYKLITVYDVVKKLITVENTTRLVGKEVKGNPVRNSRGEIEIEEKNISKDPFPEEWAKWLSEGEGHYYDVIKEYRQGNITSTNPDAFNGQGKECLYGYNLYRAEPVKLISIQVDEAVIFALINKLESVDFERSYRLYEKKDITQPFSKNNSQPIVSILI